MPEEEKVSKISLDMKILLPILTAFMAWGVSIEVRLASSLPQRVSNLETALMPIMVEYGVRQELAKQGQTSGSETPVVEHNGEVAPSKPEFSRLVTEQRTIAEEKLNKMK